MQSRFELLASGGSAAAVAAAAALLLLAGTSTASPAAAPQPLITPGPDINHLLLARQQDGPVVARSTRDVEYEKCSASSSALFSDRPVADRAAAEWFLSIYLPSRSSEFATQTSSTGTYDITSICSASDIVNSAPVTVTIPFTNAEHSSAWESYLSASRSYFQQPRIQSSARALVTSCGSVGANFMIGNVLLQVQTDIQDCITAHSLLQGYELTATGDDQVTSTLSTGGAARETGACIARAAVAAAAAVAGAVGVAGI